MDVLKYMSCIFLSLGDFDGQDFYTVMEEFVLDYL